MLGPSPACQPKAFTSGCLLPSFIYERKVLGMPLCIQTIFNTTCAQNRMFEFSVSFCPRFAKGFFAKGCTTQAVFNCCSKQKSKHNLKLAGSHRTWSDLQNQLNQVHPDQERWCLPKCRVLHRPASLNLILELQTQKFLSATQKCESDIFTAKVKVSVYKGELVSVQVSKGCKTINLKLHEKLAALSKILQ